MENHSTTKDILKRYYRGETTIEEERLLKALARQGELPDDPILAYKGKEKALPEEFLKEIQGKIRRQKHASARHLWITAAGIAAMLILIISLRSLLPHPVESLQLSDNIKKERFENALRVLGNILGETSPPVQKVLYEDNKLIIAVEE